MNLRQLEIFGAVMATGTTIGAARELNMAQPSVSNSIAHLESQLKIKLFHREKGRLEPTEEAKILYEKSLAVFDAFDAARFTVERLKDANFGTLRIACTPSPGDTLVPTAIRLFSEKYPDVKVSFLVGSLEFVHRSVELGHVDLGVFYISTDHPVLSTKRICAVDMVCAVPRSHPLSGRGVITPKDLVGESLISLSMQEPLGAMIDNAFLQCGVERQISYEVRFLHSARRLVGEGLGLAVVDSFNLLLAEREPEVMYRLFEPRIVTPAFVAHANNRPFPRLARLFSDTLAVCGRRVEKQMREIAEGYP